MDFQGKINEIYFIQSGCNEEIDGRSRPVSSDEIHWAMKCNDMVMLKELLSHDVVDTMGRDEMGYSPFASAVLQLNVEACRLLIERGGIDVNEVVAENERVNVNFDEDEFEIESRKSQGFLHLLIQNDLMDSRRREILDLLLGCDEIDVNLTSDYSGQYPPLIAVMQKIAFDCSLGSEYLKLLEDVAIKLINHDNVKINSIDGEGRTALNFAGLYFFDDSVIEALLSHPDIDVSLSDNSYPSIFSAIDGANAGMVVALLSHPRFNHEIDSVVGEVERENNSSWYYETLGLNDAFFEAKHKASDECKGFFVRNPTVPLKNYSAVYDAFEIYLGIRGAYQKDRNLELFRTKLNAWSGNVVPLEASLEKMVDAFIEPGRLV